MKNLVRSFFFLLTLVISVSVFAQNASDNTNTPASTEKKCSKGAGASCCKKSGSTADAGTAAPSCHKNSTDAGTDAAKSQCAKAAAAQGKCSHGTSTTTQVVGEDQVAGVKMTDATTVKESKMAKKAVKNRAKAKRNEQKAEINAKAGCTGNKSAACCKEGASAGKSCCKDGAASGKGCSKDKTGTEK